VTIPTKPGWYWAKWIHGEAAQVVRLDDFGHVFITESEMPHKPNEFTDWQGPLTQPPAARHESSSPCPPAPPSH
jgi:hypothetical protein